MWWVGASAVAEKLCFCLLPGSCCPKDNAVAVPLVLMVLGFDEAVVRAVQRGCGVSLPWTSSKSTFLLGTLLWVALVEQGLGHMDPEFLPASDILWFCLCYHKTHCKWSFPSLSVKEEEGKMLCIPALVILLQPVKPDYCRESWVTTCLCLVLKGQWNLFVLKMQTRILVSVEVRIKGRTDVSFVINS